MSINENLLIGTDKQIMFYKQTHAKKRRKSQMNKFRKKSKTGKQTKPIKQSSDPSYPALQVTIWTHAERVSHPSYAKPFPQNFPA